MIVVRRHATLQRMGGSARKGFISMHIQVRGLMLLSAVALLPACASRPPPPTAAIAAPAAVQGNAKGQAHRFLMTQNGKRMSADDFDAWMKARGVRIARGAQPGKRPSQLVASKDGKRR